MVCARLCRSAADLAPCSAQRSSMRSCTWITCPRRTGIGGRSCIATRSPRSSRQREPPRDAALRKPAQPLSFVRLRTESAYDCCSTNFVITSSLDGHLKFWKKQAVGIEFVKHYRTHLGPILGLGVSADGKNLASIGADQGGKTVQDSEVKGSAKVFDVENFGQCHTRLFKAVAKALARTGCSAPPSSC